MIFSKINTPALIKILRERTRLDRKGILEFWRICETSLQRIESERQNPRFETFEAFLREISLPLESFVYPLLEGQPMDVYIECDRLTQLLDMGDVVAAEPLLAQLENQAGFDTDILYQFILCRKARLWDLLGKPSSQILPLIDEGMAISFNNFKETDIVNQILILEEPELMHMKARLLANDGDDIAAIRILESMVVNYSRIPESNKEKERRYVSILLTYASCLISVCSYERALEICELGAKYSASRKQGQFNPDFEYYIASALKGLGRLSECIKPLQHAYFGFTLLGEADRAREIMRSANEDFGIRINTYGTDLLPLSRFYRIPYNRGEPVKCSSTGEMITILRERAGLTLGQLCEGICSKPTLMRIESGETQGHILTLEALLQRLGRDVNLYHNFFLSKEDFITIQLRDRIYILIIERRYSEALVLLEELESMKHVHKYHGVQQLILLTKALAFADKNENPHPDVPILLIEALKVTCPGFDENDIDKHHLTFVEALIIGQYAGYYGNIGDYTRAAEIYERLRRNLNGKCVDSFEKARNYPTVLINYSTILGRAGRRKEALTVVAECELFERSHRRLTELPSLACNRGFNMYMLGETTDSFAYFAQAYYGSSMFSRFGQADIKDTVHDTAYKLFGLTFG